MTGYLVMADGRRVAARDGLTLGRVQCDIVLDDTKASRHHARLLVEGSVVEIEDLDSSNGTFLNDKRIKRRLLRDGDRIRIGTTTVTFAEAEAEAAAAAAARAAEPEEIEIAVELPPRRPDPYRPGGGLEGDPLAGQEPPADDVEVLEFVDEVVTVKRRAEPLPAPGPVARPPAPKGAGSSAREHGVLRFQKPVARGGVLGDDLRQMSLTQRLLLGVVALAAAAGLGWLVMKLAAGL